VWGGCRIQHRSAGIAGRGNAGDPGALGANDLLLELRRKPDVAQAQLTTSI
jgi:hypothetical protein